MSRLFNGTSDKITLNLGATNFVMGPGTVAAIVKTPASMAAIRFAFSTGTGSGATRFGIGHTAAAKIEFRISGNDLASTTSIPTSTWVMIAASKATGTVAPRFYCYDLNLGTWFVENGSVTSGNSTAATGNAFIGVGPGGTTEFWSSNILVGGMFNSILTDAQVLNLAWSLNNWRILNPSALWILNQDSVSTTVTDLSNNGATQSAIAGTTVDSSTPPQFNIGSQGLLTNRLRPHAFSPGLAR